MTRARFTKKAMRATVPSPALRVAYRKKLLALVNAIRAEVERDILQTYRADENIITLDATPADSLAKALDRIRKRFAADLDARADELAKWFVGRTINHVKRAQLSAAKDSGLPDIGVAFSLGLVSQDVTAALVQENVSLIKSIESQYLERVAGSVMRSVTAGRDLRGLAQQLHRDYDITERRAAFIARDQNDKATNQISRENVRAAGVKFGIWQHIPGRKSSRPTHEAMDGKRFELSKGMFDSAVDRWIFPGEEPGCRCRFRPVFEFEK